MHAVPGVVENPVCIKSASSGRILNISWEQPITNEEGVNDFVIEVKRYVQPLGSRMLELHPLDPPYWQEIDMLTAAVMLGVGEF